MLDAPLVDVPAIAGKSEPAVAAALGAATGCKSVSPTGVGEARRCDYRGGNVEVVYIAGKADWITVYGAEAPAADQPALSGKVSLFKVSAADDTLSYAYLKASTP